MSTAPPLPPAPPGSTPPGSTPPGSSKPLTGDRQDPDAQTKNQPAAAKTSTAAPQEKLSTALTGLLPGAILSGTVSGTVSGGSGELVFETAASAHRLVGEVKVAPGDAVELRIVSLDAGVQAELLSVNGEPRATPVVLESVAAASIEITAPPGPGTTLGGNVIATPAAGESGPLGRPRLSLTTGSAIEVRVATVAMPPDDTDHPHQPQIQGTVVEASESSAVVETTSGRLELAVSGAEPGMRIAVAATDAPPPPAPKPLARDVIVAAQPESGPAIAVRIVSAEPPPVQGTIIEAAENRAVLETTSGWLELAVGGAEPGMRIAITASEAPPPPAPVPLVRGAITAAQPENGPSTVVRIVSIEAPPPEIRGTVVEVGENKTVVETPFGRLDLTLSAPVPLGTRVAAEAVPQAPPAVAPPLVPGSLVAARTETDFVAGQSSIAAGSDVALLISATEPPPHRLQGTVVDAAKDRAVLETPAGRLTLALAGAALGTRIEAEVVATPPDSANSTVPGSLVEARAGTVVNLGGTIVAPQESLTLRIISLTGPSHEPPRLTGQVVASDAGRTLIDTAFGELAIAAEASVGQRLQLDVISRDAGVHNAVPSAGPEPLAPGRQVAAEIVGSGQPLVLRVVSVEAPQIRGTVVEASDDRAIIETASGPITLAVSGTVPGARVVAEIATAPAPAASVPLAPDAVVAAQPESGPAVALRIVSSEAPAPQIRGTVVEASENRAVVETASGRLEFAVSGAEPGARIAAATTDAPPPLAPVPLAREAIVAAQPESGPPLAVRIVSVETPQFRGTVVEVSENRAVIETDSGRVALAISGAESGARITMATTDAPPPPDPVPLARDAVVTAKPATGPEQAVRIIAVEAPQLQGTVVEAAESRAVIETASGRLELATSGAAPGARITLATADAPPPTDPVPLTREAIVAAQPESGPALAVRIVAIEAAPLQGTIVEATGNSAVAETTSGRLELAVSGAEAGARITIATTDAAPPPAPVPLANDAIVAAKPETGPVQAVHIITVEAPHLQATVVEAMENSAVVETTSGRFELAVSGAEVGARITIATSEAPPPPAALPLAREAVVTAQPETGPEQALRIVAVEAPQLQGTVVEASENHAVVETASGRLEFAVSGAEPGARIAVTTTDAPPPPTPVPLAPEAIVAAQPETGPPLAVRIVSVEAPQFRGTVVEVSENHAVVETDAGRITLAITGAQSETQITIATTDALPPPTPVPLARDAIVAAQPQTGPTLAMRIVDIEAPQLQGTVVEASESGAVVETAAGRLELAVSGGEPGARITVAATDAPPPPVPVPLARDAIVAAKPQSGPAQAMRIVDVEAPQLQGAVVEASESRAVVETASGRVELAVSGAAPGMRVTATATETPPPPVPVPLVREALVAATPDSGPAVAVRIVSIEAPQIRGTVVEATENSAVLETATGRLELAVSGANPGARVVVATMEAPPPPAPVPLAREAIVAAQPETGPAIAVRIVAVEAPPLEGTVVEASENRAVIDTDSGRLALAVSGAEPGARIVVAASDAPPPPAPAPLAREAIVAAQPETGPAMVVRIVSVETPALRLRATVVVASEGRSEVETQLGQLVLAASAEPGSRLDLDILSPTESAPRVPSSTVAPGHMVAAEIAGSGQVLQLRVAAVVPPAPRLQGTVVKVSENSAVIETTSGRLNLQLSTPPALATLITAEIAETPPPTVALPLAADQVVAARIESVVGSGPAALAAGSVLALRISEIEAPAERLQGRIVDAGPERALIESDVGRLSVASAQTPTELPLAARIEAEIVPPASPGAPSPAAENVVAARAESVLTTASTIIAPGEELSLRLLSVSDPAPQPERLSGIAVASSPGRTQVETAAGHLELLAETTVGQRLEFDVISHDAGVQQALPDPPPGPAGPLQPGRQIAAEEVASGQPLVLRVVAAEAAPAAIEGRVVEAAGNRMLVETGSGRLGLATESPLPRGTIIDLEVVEAPSPATPQPLMAGSVVAATLESTGSLAKFEPATPLAGLDIGAPLALRVASVALPDSQPAAELGARLRAQVVAQEGNRAIVTAAGEKYSLPVTAVIGSRMTIELTAAAGPEARLVEPGTAPLPPPTPPSPGLARLDAVVAGTSATGRLLLDTAAARLAVAGVKGRPGTPLALDLVSRGSTPEGLTQVPQLAVGEQVTAIVVAVQAEPRGTGPTVPLEPGTPLVLKIAAIAGQESVAATGAAGTSTAGSKSNSAAVTAPALLSGSDPNHLTGVVSGLAPGGELLVQTREGLLALESDTRPPAGTLLEFEIVAVQPPGPAGQAGSSPVTNTSAAPGEAPAIAIGQTWPALGETMAVLQNLDVALAQNLGNAMPAANSRLASAILLFVAALRGGDVRGWLGDEAGRGLERSGRRDLLARLGRDMGQLNRATEEPVSGEWRALPVPFQDGRELRQLWLFFRPIDPDDSAGGDSTAGDEGGMRFVLDLELSALGPLQLSGLVREKRFDLIVHSQRPLAAGVQQEIQSIFAEGSALGDAAGNLAFRSGPPYPRSPAQDAGGSGGQEITT